MCQHAQPEESWADVLNKTGTQCFCWPSFLWTVSKLSQLSRNFHNVVFLELLHSAKYFMFTKSGNREACPFLSLCKAVRNTARVYEVEVTYNRCEPFQRIIFKGYETLCWVLNHISSTVGMYSSTEAGCCDPSSSEGNCSNTNNQMETAEGKNVIFLWKWWIQWSQAKHKVIKEVVKEPWANGARQNKEIKGSELEFHLKFTNWLKRKLEK